MCGVLPVELNQPSYTSCFHGNNDVLPGKQRSIPMIMHNEKKKNVLISLFTWFNIVVTIPLSFLEEPLKSCRFLILDFHNKVSVLRSSRKKEILENSLSLLHSRQWGCNNEDYRMMVGAHCLLKQGTNANMAMHSC